MYNFDIIGSCIRKIGINPVDPTSITTAAPTTTLPISSTSSTSSTSTSSTSSTSTSSTSTSSTTSAPPSMVWTYTMRLLSCEDCTVVGGGSFTNSQELVVGNYYASTSSPYKILILEFVSVVPGNNASSNILTSSGATTCQGITCVTSSTSSTSTSSTSTSSTTSTSTSSTSTTTNPCTIAGNATEIII
jgi:hypothetical protein